MKVELLHSNTISDLLSQYWRVSILEEIPSTQSELKKQNPKPWDLIAAEFQSAGRGRLDRSFEAPKSSALLFSYFVRPMREKNDWGFLPLLSGYVLAKTVNEMTKSDIYSCKWPNDLLSRGKKIAGILTEVHDEGVIIGIGVNTTITANDLPTSNASSIFLESNMVLSRNTLLANFCNNYFQDFSEWDNGKNFVSNYSSICSTLNREVRIIDSSREWMGRAISISKSGALILESGEEVTVGDVVHIRD